MNRNVLPAHKALGRDIAGKEEERVITGSETDAAINLNEPIRTNHSGVPVIVNGPTSRTKIAEAVPSIIIRQKNQNSSVDTSKKINE